ncbi:MAG: hypothetical protein ABR520_07730, partial [Mycobacteriales bacterium]
MSATRAPDRHGLRTLAVTVWLASLAVSVLGLGCAVAAATLRAFSGIDATIGLSFPLVGALIAVRRPTHRVGWLLLVGGLCSSLQVSGTAYGYYAVVTRGRALAGGDWAA